MKVFRITNTSKQASTKNYSYMCNCNCGGGSGAPKCQQQAYIKPAKKMKEIYSK